MSCLIYTCHRIAPLPPGTEEPGTAPLAAFVRQLKWLKRLGVEFIRMSDLLAWLEGRRTIPRRSAVLTFDDAYASVAEFAFPILKAENIPFTIFVVAGLIGCESNLYEHRGGKTQRHLDLDELKMLINSGLVEIGAHGYHHLDVTNIGKGQLREELKGAKAYLEDQLDLQVLYFAYPFGKTSDVVSEEVKHCGYKLAFTTRKMKVISGRVDFMQLPRVNWSRRATLFKLYKYFLIPFQGARG
jgi:peptidoglycan/xylan/chitin deacetylase (PgdA/CDA1 family)